jgi:hypothetical protein
MGKMYPKSVSTISHAEKNAVFNETPSWLLIYFTNR